MEPLSRSSLFTVYTEVLRQIGQSKQSRPRSVLKVNTVRKKRVERFKIKL